MGHAATVEVGPLVVMDETARAFLMYGPVDVERSPCSCH